MNISIHYRPFLLLVLIPFFSCNNTPTDSLAIKKLPPIIAQNTTLTENTLYLIKESLLITSNTTLTIEPGVKITFCDTCIILCEGNIKAKGEPDNKIVIGESLLGNRIIIEESSATSFQNIHFKNASISINNGTLLVDSCIFTTTVLERKKPDPSFFISSNQSNITIQNSIFYGNTIKEGLGFNHGQCIINNNVFDSVPDAIELSNIHIGQIKKNVISYSTDDGIDLNNCKNITVSNNIIQYSNDKGISIGNNEIVGPEEMISLDSNLIQNNEIGISIKDYSLINVFYCILESNKTGIVFNPKKELKTRPLILINSSFFSENNNNYKPIINSAMLFKDCFSNQILPGNENSLFGNEKNEEMALIKAKKVIAGH